MVHCAIARMLRFALPAFTLVLVLLLIMLRFLELPILSDVLIDRRVFVVVVLALSELFAAHDSNSYQFHNVCESG